MIHGSTFEPNQHLPKQLEFLLLNFFRDSDHFGTTVFVKTVESFIFGQNWTGSLDYCHCMYSSMYLPSHNVTSVKEW